MSEMTIDKSKLLFTDSFITEALKENINKVISFVEVKLENNNVDPILISRVSVCVDEIFANICFYAYKEDSNSRKCEIIINIYESFFTVTFIDEGIEFDPTIQNVPDMSGGVNERKIGGLGIFVVKKMMDEVVYKRDNNKNVLTIKKVL